MTQKSAKRKHPSHPKRSGRPGGRARRGTRRARPLDWVRAARLPTLPLSVAPVLLGAAIATVGGAEWDWLVFAGCLVVAVALQIGVNYANDFSDGIRGTDDVRSGPTRLTASGAASPRAVLAAALIFFGVAAAAGLLVTWRTGHWWFLAVGAVAIVAAWFYTGGRRPYGYLGLGEAVVFVFFGLVAVLGTQFALQGTANLDGLLLGVAAGAFASATILVANLRDRPQDAVVGKRTLSVLIGARASRALYIVLTAVPYAVAVVFALVAFDRAWFVLFVLLVSVPAVVIVVMARTPRELVTALKLTAASSVAYALVLGWAIAF